MNIAFFVGSFPVLSETFILNQITGLIDRGHKVDIYAKKILPLHTIHEDVRKYSLGDITFCHGDTARESPGGFFTRSIGAAKHLLKKEQDGRTLLKTLDFRHFGTDALSFRLLYRSLPFLKSPRKYDIVHCHFGPNGKIAVDLKLIGALNSRIVTTFHGSDITQYVRRKGSGTYARLFREGDLFLPISERWKSRLIELGCPESKILVHRMGIDTAKFKASPPPRAEDGTTRILSVGRLVPKKGFADGIRAVADLLQRGRRIEYLIVGDGPLREPLETLARSSGAGNRIRLLGWKTQEEVLELIRGAEIFLAPSVTDEKGNQEGLPVVLMEAQAMAKPVVSTFHSGIPELVRDGISGFLAPEGDVTDLRQKLEYLINHPEKGIEMGREGRKCVVENFDINTLNDRLITFYESLLESRFPDPKESKRGTGADWSRMNA